MALSLNKLKSVYTNRAVMFPPGLSIIRDFVVKNLPLCPSCGAVVKRAGLVRFAVEFLRSRVRVRVQATAPYLIRTFGIMDLSRAI